MSIIANITKIEGNIVFLETVPQTGVLTLTGFSDDASGVSGSVNFTKVFRYSKDGVIFSDWQELTTNNILSLVFAKENTVAIELKYIKNQPVGTDTLQVSKVTFTTTNDIVEDGFYFKKSNFDLLFNSEDSNVLMWTINVLNKLWNKGLIADYLDREGDDGKSDDFIEFWRSLCKYFAYYVVFARQFENFKESNLLLSEFLKERGICTSPYNSLSELKLLMNKYYNQIAKRGTVHIYDKIEDGDSIDGELLRLINYNKITDDIIFNFNKPEHVGWNLKNSSPLYRGLSKCDNANKFYESSKYPVDIAKYPITANVSLVDDVSVGGKVFLISGGGGIQNQDTSKLIKVNEYQDYELSFLIKKSDGDNLTVGFDVFDKDKEHIDLVSIQDGTVKNDYFSNVNLQRADKYIEVKVFLYNKLKPLNYDDPTNGLVLRAGAVYVVPKILVNGVDASIYNVRFIPMFTNYSKGFVQVENFIDLWLKNNNNEFTFKGICDFVRKYLINYNDFIKISSIELCGDYSIYKKAIKPLDFITLPADDITNDSAVVGGNIVSDGGLSIAERGIVWSIDQQPTINNNKVSNGSGVGKYTNTITQLPQGKVIYVRAYLITSDGAVIYADQISFNSSALIVSIKRVSNQYSKESSVQFNVKFSASITGLTSNNFGIVNDESISDTSITDVAGSGDTWIVTVNTGSGDGELGISFINSNFLSPYIGNYPFGGEKYIMDKTAPVVTLTDKPDSVITSNIASFGFNAVDSGSGLDKILVSIDGAAYVEKNSPVILKNLTNGEHVFAIKATDKVGNESTSITYNYTVAVHSFTAYWGWSNKPFAAGQTDTGAITALGEVGRTPGNSWVQQIQITGAPKVGGRFSLSVYGNSIDHYVVQGDTVASIIVDLKNKVNALQVHAYNPPPNIISAQVKPLDSSVLEITFDYQHSASCGYTPADYTAIDVFTYQGNGIFKDNISADYKLAPANSYLILKYPKTEVSKNFYYNSAINSGSIPSNIWGKFIIDNDEYIVSKMPLTLDSNSLTVFSKQ